MTGLGGFTNSLTLVHPPTSNAATRLATAMSREAAVMTQSASVNVTRATSILRVRDPLLECLAVLVEASQDTRYLLTVRAEILPGGRLGEYENEVSARRVVDGLEYAGGGCTRFAVQLI